MHSISSKYRKPKGRPSKRKQDALAKLNKRWAALTPDDSTLSNKQPNEASSTSIAFEDKPSTSALKLSSFEVNKENTGQKSNEMSGYAFINMNAWKNMMENIKCSECICGNLIVNHERNNFGFSTKFEVKCQNCDYIFGSTFSSPRVPEKKQFDINKKVVEAFLKFGKGHAAIEHFSMVLGMQSIDKKTFARCLNSLSQDGENVKDQVLEMARTFVHKKHREIDPSLSVDDVIDITVSYDGTWHKRGYTSLYGMGIVIDILTGLVVDFKILSKYCPECTAASRDLNRNSAEYAIWFEGHRAECQKNFDGSSGSMETSAAHILWCRSIQDCKMRYTALLSDGDSKAHQMLQETKPYGPDVTINKEECINHVAKRMGAGLRNKVKEWRTKGITLGGKKPGSLKEATIVKLTNFYRKAINDNIPNVDKMKTAIYASLFHSSSSDAKPKHNKCPEGKESWCFYQRALAEKTVPRTHKQMKTQISEEVLEKILPIYQRLASNELLSRCIHGQTQNANESLHSLIWNYCPKETFISKKRLELSVVSSISEFNMGCLGTLEIKDKHADELSVSIARKRDNRRIKLSDKKNTPVYKQTRRAKRYNKTVTNQNYSKSEGVTYKAGMF